MWPVVINIKAYSSSPIPEFPNFLIITPKICIILDFCAVLLTYPKNISAVKKGEAKKMQVAERPKDVISL